MDNVVVFCDWLQYSVMLEEELPELECPDGFRLEVLQGNNIFRHRCLVFDSKGRKWLTLLWSPFSSVLNSRIMTVQVANMLLYYGGVHESYRLLKQKVPCHFNSCGRMDVCCDFEMDNKKMDTLKHLNSGHYYVQGKSEGSTWWHKITEGSGNREFKRNQLHCLSWGSKNTDIKVKCYHKTREINALSVGSPCEKPYIVEAWRLAGLDISNVWRVEFSLSGTGRLKWQNEIIDLDKVASTEWLKHVFYSLYGSRFVIRINQGKRQGHKNQDEIVEFLRLPPESTLLTRSLGVLDDKACSDGVKLLRKMMAMLSSPAVMSNDTVCSTLCESVATLVKEQGLSAYFLGHFGADYMSYLQDVVDRSGSGCYEVDGTPTKAWM